MSKRWLPAAIYFPVAVAGALIGVYEDQPLVGGVMIFGAWVVAGTVMLRQRRR